MFKKSRGRHSRDSITRTHIPSVLLLYSEWLLFPVTSQSKSGTGTPVNMFGFQPTGKRKGERALWVSMKCWVKEEMETFDVWIQSHLLSWEPSRTVTRCSFKLNLFLITQLVKIYLSLIFLYHLWSRRFQISFVLATETFLKIKNKHTTSI